MKFMHVKCYCSMISLMSLNQKLVTIQQEHSGDEGFSGKRVFLNWGQFPVMVSLPQSVLSQFDWWQ